MPTLRFEGYSDDTFGEYAVTNEDYDNAASGKPIRFRVEADGLALIVSGQYAPKGTGGWLIGVASIDEPNGDDIPLPPWPIRIGPGTDRPYTPALYIDVPDGFTLKHVRS
jgi:hypothetical protein